MTLMQGTQCYVCACRLEGLVGYFLWLTVPTGDDPDRIWHDGDEIPVLPSEAAARTYMAAQGIVAEPEAAAMYDLDAIRAWCQRPDSAALDYAAALNAWNLFTDLPTAADASLFGHADRRASPVYNKLFWGNNLPAVTPAGAAFVPEWSPDELAALRQTLELGLASFASRVSRR